MLWYSVLPYIDIGRIAAQTSDPADVMLYQTSELVHDPALRIHALERMRHFVWNSIFKLYDSHGENFYNQNDMHDVIDFVEDFMQQTSPLFASNFKYDLGRYNIWYTDQNHAYFIDPKPAECNTLNSVLPSFSPSIIEEYRLTESSQGFADAYLCIKKQATKRQCVTYGGLAFQSNIPCNEPKFLLMADRLGGISGCMKNIRFLYRMQICHQTNQLQGTIHSSAQ